MSKKKKFWMGECDKEEGKGAKSDEILSLLNHSMNGGGGRGPRVKEA